MKEAKICVTNGAHGKQWYGHHNFQTVKLEFLFD